MVEDCSQYCSILHQVNAILDKIKELEAEHKNKTYSKEALDNHTKLNQKIQSLQDTHSVCMMDCKQRNRHRSQGEEPPPIDKTLRKELEQLDDSDDDFGGGNKRRARLPRVPRLPRRRRSLRNRTHRQPRQTRRNQRRNTQRRNGRHHRTRSDRK